MKPIFPEEGRAGRLELSEGGRTNCLASSLGAFAQHLCRLVTADAATPLTALFLVLVGEISLGGADNGGQLALVLTLDVLNR